MLKIGNLIINTSAIAFVQLHATKSYVSDRKDATGVRIVMTTNDKDGCPSCFFFSGDDAEKLRKYFEHSIQSLDQ